MTYRKKCKNDINLTGIEQVNNIIYDYKAQLEHSEKYKDVLWEIKNCVGSFYSSSNNIYCIYTPYVKMYFEFCKNCGELQTDPDMSVSGRKQCKCEVEQEPTLIFFS